MPFGTNQDLFFWVPVSNALGSTGRLQNLDLVMPEDARLISMGFTATGTEIQGGAVLNLITPSGTSSDIVIPDVNVPVNTSILVEVNGDKNLSLKSGDIINFTVGTAASQGAARIWHLWRRGA